jgi:hypothetical protein
MFKNSSYFIVLAIFLLSACSSQPAQQNDMAQESDSNVELAENSSSENDPNEVICRREMVTGSNFRKRVCLTRAQRGEMRAMSREEFIERRSGTLGAAPAGPAN